MKKKWISLVTSTVLSVTIASSAFAAPGTVERSVNFRSAPNTGSSVYQTIKAGQKVDILSQVNSYWYKVSYNGKVGYVSTDYVGAGSTSSRSGVVERGVNFRSAPNTNSSVHQLIKAGQTVTILNQVNSYWYQISYNGKVGYVSTSYIRASSAPGGGATTPPSSASKADRIIAHAQALTGKITYKYGVNTPNVMDCSAFTKHVFAQEGISLKWGTRYQKSAGTSVSKSNLKKGDLVFFSTSSPGTIGHVGIYIGNGKFIHSSPSFNGVGTSSLETGYWASRYISAQRVL